MEHLKKNVRIVPMTHEHLDEVAALEATHPGTKLVIIDTLQTVRQSSQKSAYASDYRDVRAFKGLAERFGIAIVLVHHQRKMDDPDPFNTVSGTNGITGAADTTMVVLIPGMGDDIQAIKAGILEIGDLFTINKADLDGADKLVREINMMQ